MKRCIFLLLLCFSILVSFAYADDCSITVVGEYGTEGINDPYCGLAISYDSLLIGGSRYARNGKTNSADMPAQDGWLFSIGTDGKMKNEYEISSDATLGAHIAIEQLYYGQPYIVMLAHNESPQDNSIVVLDSEGNISRTNAFINRGEISISDSVSTQHGILLIGSKTVGQSSDLWLGLINGVGSFEWEYSIPSLAEDHFPMALKCAYDDSGVSVYTRTNYPATSSIMRFDYSGALISTTQLTLTNNESLYIRDMAISGEYTYFFGSAAKTFGGKGWVACVDANGNEIWRSEYDGIESLYSPLILDETIICAASGNSDCQIAVIIKNGEPGNVEYIKANIPFKVRFIAKGQEEMVWIIGTRANINEVGGRIVAATYNYK